MAEGHPLHYPDVSLRGAKRRSDLTGRGWIAGSLWRKRDRDIRVFFSIVILAEFPQNANPSPWISALIYEQMFDIMRAEISGGEHMEDIVNRQIEMISVCAADGALTPIRFPHGGRRAYAAHRPDPAGRLLPGPSPMPGWRQSSTSARRSWGSRRRFWSCAILCGRIAGRFSGWCTDVPGDLSCGCEQRVPVVVGGLPRAGAGRTGGPARHSLRRGRRACRTARHHSGQEHSSEKVRRENRRADLSGAAKCPG